jgi:RNA polymerase-binding transcription factor DksA
MAYENQNKCERCGISIPFVHEDADFEASYCDKCLEEVLDG